MDPGSWAALIFVATSYVGSITAITWGISKRIRESRRQWRNLLETCGLTIVSASKSRIEALAGELAVQCRRVSLGTQVMVGIPGPPGFSGMVIRREPSRRPPEVREIEIGDPAFDRTFLIEGPTRLASLLLTAEARELLLLLNTESSGMGVSGGELVALIPEARLSELLPLLLDVGRRFAQPVDAAQRLAENVRHDPQPGARLRNLILLAREFPGDPRTADTLRLACADASLDVRLRAAKELGAEGHAVLLEIAEGLKDDACSGAAVSALGRELPFERLRALLSHTLRLRSLQTARACLEELGHDGTAAAVETLAKVLAREQGELAAAAATAIGQAGGTAAESPLIQALQRDWAELRVAAANALGLAGSTAAVLPLKEAAARFPNDKALQRAARQAIGEIQSRIGASPGQLSLSGDEAGRLSLAQAEAGQLSLATKTGGELSLPSAEPGHLSVSPAKTEDTGSD